MNHRLRVLIPSLLMATGVLGGALVSVLTSASGLLTMLGPLVMASTLVIASRIAASQDPAQQEGLRPALILAVSILLASAMVAMSDPSQVAILMPFFGAGGLILAPRNCRRQRETLGDTEKV